jgi:hypothetical protein
VGHSSRPVATGLSYMLEDQAPLGGPIPSEHLDLISQARLQGGATASVWLGPVFSLNGYEQQSGYSV